jgi:hypothetical protein
MWRLALALGLMVIAVGCTTKWVHPDPTADWDAAYADCFQKAEAADSGEMDTQAMKDCLEAKGWEVKKPWRPLQLFQPDRPVPKPPRKTEKL